MTGTQADHENTDGERPSPDSRRFLTDDLGRFDGRLTIMSRIDDVIVTGGYKVSPAVVEDVVRAIDGIRDAVAVARPHERWGQCVAVAIVTDEAPEATTNALERLATETRKTLPPYAVPLLAQAVDELPLTGVGKPDRAFIATLPGWHNLR